MTTKTQVGFRFEQVAPIFALVFVDVLGLTIILPLLHLYAAAYGATPLQIGLVVAAFPLAQLIGVPAMGALSDRYGRKPLLLISQVSTCFSFILLGTAQSLEMIILSRVIDGLFGANIATAQAALSDITNSETRARGLGLVGAAFGLGFIFGPIIAILTLEISDNFAIPAYTAAVYSFLSILLTLFLFKETLPPFKRGRKSTKEAISLWVIGRFLGQRGTGLLLMLIFAQQLIFFGFESLMGLFMLSRLGLLGQGNAFYFIIIGLILVVVQVRFIGPWSIRYGERWLVYIALASITVGLLMVAMTPEQPHPFYVRGIVERDLRDQAISASEAIIGDLGINLPTEGNNGLGGVLWMLIAIIPLSIGAGLIRPAINTLLTKQVSERDYGAILGVSAALVSLANALAPILGGWIFQHSGPSAPFLWGGIIMAFLLILSIIGLRYIQDANMV